MYWLLWSYFVPYKDNRAVSAAQIPSAQIAPSASPITPAQALAEFGSEAVCVLDEQLHCYYLSPNWYNISGVNAEDALAEEFKKRIASDHVRRVSRYLVQKHHPEPLRFQMGNAEGQLHWLELRILPLPKDEGKYSCLLRDVTDLINAQARQEKAMLEADLALKSRSEFLANMSHELRTPLNAILGFSQMMDSGTYGPLGHPKYHEYIGNIQESGSTLLAKISDLIQIANIDTGKLVLHDSRFDLCELLHYALEYHSHHAFSRHVHLQSGIPKKPVFIVADRIRLLQVVTNLINNAIKYNRDDGYVHLSCSARKDGSIAIVVKDNGEGIAASHLKSILSAFRQSDSFFARSRDCMGLGLALSKEIVKLHQGRIEIESETGKGTELTICLPKERALAATDEPALTLSELVYG